MKKQSFLVTIISVLFFSNAPAQSTNMIPDGSAIVNNLPKNAISFRAGIFTTQGLYLDNLAENRLDYDYKSSVAAGPAYSIAYKRHLNKRIAFETAYTTQQVKQTVDDRRIRLIETFFLPTTTPEHGLSEINWSVKSWHNELQVYWMRTKEVSLYSGAGITFASYKPEYGVINDPEVRNQLKAHTNTRAHVTAVGIEIGHICAISADFGLGTKGVAGISGSYKF